MSDLPGSASQVSRPGARGANALVHPMLDTTRRRTRRLAQQQGYDMQLGMVFNAFAHGYPPVPQQQLV